jgi:hypothetical protein
MIRDPQGVMSDERVSEGLDHLLEFMRTQPSIEALTIKPSEAHGSITASVNGQTTPVSEVPRQVYEKMILQLRARANIDPTASEGSLVFTPSNVLLAMLQQRRDEMRARANDYPPDAPPPHDEPLAIKLIFRRGQLEEEVVLERATLPSISREGQSQ